MSILIVIFFFDIFDIYIYFIIRFSLPESKRNSKCNGYNNCVSVKCHCSGPIDCKYIDD